MNIEIKRMKADIVFDFSAIQIYIFVYEAKSTFLTLI